MLLVNQERIYTRIEQLSKIVDPQLPKYTRRAFTDTYAISRQWLTEEFRSAGLITHLDHCVNLIGRREGSNLKAPAIVLGSHTDTVNAGGRFDGTAGVVAALEVAQVLNENDVQLRHPLEVTDFLAEEPNDYGASCVGSRGLAGTLTSELLNGSNAQGETLSDAIRRMGGDPEHLTGQLRAKSDIAAFLELHIEQGPTLESNDCPVGVVSGIVGIRRYLITITGEANHSGTTPMHHRKDALVGASSLIREVFYQARQETSETGIVATVGRVSIEPNSANVIPGEVQLVLEARAPKTETVTSFVEGILMRGRDQLHQEGLEIKTSLLSDAPPVLCSSEIQVVLQKAARKRGYPHMTVTSGAGHDAMQIANLCPVGMLFVPSVNGISHHPEEFTQIEHLTAGTEVLLESVIELDQTGMVLA